jgi:hypothetical protein
MPDDRVRIILSPSSREGNLTIVGDWFAADSLVPRPGLDYRQTVFYSHAPTVLYWLRQFDQEFRELERARGGEDGSSRRSAVAEIEEVLRGLPTT